VICSQRVDQGEQRLAGPIRLDVAEILLKASETATPDVLSQAGGDQAFLTASQIETECGVREITNEGKLFRSNFG
jgi:hypothetical protein